MGADTIRLDECTSLFPAVHGTLHGRISRSVYSTILGWPTNLFSNFWATLRASATSTSETKETWHQSQGVQIPNVIYSNVKFHILVESYHLQVIQLIPRQSQLCDQKKPSSITELRSILGLVGYFRRSIPNLSQTGSPLYQILTDTQNKQRHSKEPIDWNDIYKQL